MQVFPLENKTMKTFPWPVLTDEKDGDYPGQYILTDDLKCTFSGSDLVIEWSPSTNCSYINQLLSENKVYWVIETICPRTLLVSRKKHNAGPLRVEHSAEDVRGTLYFRAHIVATSQITIKPNGLKSGLEGEYILDAGDQLGTFELSFETNLEYIKNPGLKSLLTFRAATEEEKDINYHVTMPGDRIVVVLPKKVYEKYALSRQSQAGYKFIASALLILPALIESISRLDEQAKASKEPLKAEDVEQAALQRLAILLKARVGINPSDIKNFEGGYSSIALKIMQGDQSGSILQDCLTTLTK
jgi:hypothetical protein